MAERPSGVPLQRPPVDPQLSQLSPEYWQRVGRAAAVQRAAKPGDTAAQDAKDRATNDYLAPPAGPGRQAFAHGGPVINDKSSRKKRRRQW
jgi:hypothetical protein